MLRKNSTDHLYKSFYWEMYLGKKCQVECLGEAFKDPYENLNRMMSAANFLFCNVENFIGYEKDEEGIFVSYSVLLNGRAEPIVSSIIEQFPNIIEFLNEIKLYEHPSQNRLALMDSMEYNHTETTEYEERLDFTISVCQSCLEKMQEKNQTKYF